MKKILAIALLSGLVLAGCKKEEENNANGVLEPANTSRAVVFKFTGSWCFACPQGGTVRLAETQHNFPNNTVPIAVHINDGLSSGIGSVFQDNFFTGGTPNFFVNDVAAGQGGMSGTVAQISQQPCVVGAGHEWTVSGSTVSVKSKVKFFESASGTYYVGAYLIQGPVDAVGGLTQTETSGLVVTENGESRWGQDAGGVNVGGQLEYLFKEGEMFEHTHAVSASPTGTGSWGEVLPITSFSPGDAYTMNFSISIPQTAVRQGMKIATIVWKEEANGDVFAVNGYYK